MYDAMCTYISKINTSQRTNWIFSNVWECIFGVLFLNEGCVVFSEFILEKGAQQFPERNNQLSYRVFCPKQDHNKWAKWHLVQRHMLYILRQHGERIIEFSNIILNSKGCISRGQYYAAFSKVSIAGTYLFILWWLVVLSSKA